MAIKRINNRASISSSSFLTRVLVLILASSSSLAHALDMMELMEMMEIMSMSMSMSMSMPMSMSMSMSMPVMSMPMSMSMSFSFSMSMGYYIPYESYNVAGTAGTAGASTGHVRVGRLLIEDDATLFGDFRRAALDSPGTTMEFGREAVDEGWFMTPPTEKNVFMDVTSTPQIVDSAQRKLHKKKKTTTLKRLRTSNPSE